jgi:hypothetical protein
MDKIEACNLLYKVGTVMTKSELIISFMTVRNNITRSHLPFMKSVSIRSSKTILFC